MTGLLLQIGATKLTVSVVLAGAVWMVQRRVGGPPSPTRCGCWCS